MIKKLLPFCFFLLLSIIPAHAEVISKAESLYHEALQYYDLGYDGRAMAALHKGIKSFPNNPLFHKQLADIFFDKEHFDQALAHYLEALFLYQFDSDVKKEDLGDIHLLITLCAYQIGLKKYFSKDLCARIFYHADQYLNLLSEPSDDYQNLLVVIKDVARKYPAQEPPDDRPSLNLPDDPLSEEEKAAAKENIFHRLEN